MRRILLRRALGLALVSACAAGASAQTNVTGVRLGGLGRAVVTNDRLSGDALAGDTTNARRSAGGYSLVDMAFEAAPNRDTEARVVLRLRTDLGGFFGDGYRFGIRELYLRGTIADRVTYSVGDMDLKLTPLTVFSTPETAVNEADVFSLRRDIVRYETFDYGDNTWRLQGLRTGVGLSFDQGVQRASALAFVSRTAPTSGTVPDRLLGGGQVRVDVSDAVQGGVTLVNLFDLDGTGSAPALSNPVVTADGRAALPVPGVGTVGVRAEVGASRASFGEGSPVAAREDYAVDAGVFATVMGVAVAAGVRDVGPQFYSAAAQTRRLPYDAAPDLFSTARGFGGARDITQYDAISQEGLYTNRIEPRLLGFDPRLDPAEPYGRATPNRRGVTLSVGGAAMPGAPATGTAAAERPLVSATARLDLLREIVGEGTPERRRFTVGEGTADVALGRLGLPPATLTLGLRLMRTRRADAPFPVTLDDGTAATADTGAVSLRSALVNAGLTARVVPRVDALLGVKVLSARGNEFRALRDDTTDPYRITGFAPLAYDGAQTLVGAGLRYSLRETTALTVEGALLRVSDDMRTAGGYRIANLFLHYVLTF